MAAASRNFVLLVAIFATASGAKVAVSPVQKVVQLLDDFKAKTIAEGKASQNAFAEYAKWCDDEADAKVNAIKDTNVEIQDLTATISESQATITNLETKIGEITNQIAATEKELSSAKEGREAGTSTFSAAEHELSGTVNELGTAYAMNKKEMGGASFAQLPEAKRNNLRKTLSGLKTIVDSAWVTTQQKEKITAFLQNKANAEEDDDDMEPSSGAEGVLDTISDMEEKAEDSLGEERKQEMKDQNAFALLKMALLNEMKDLKSELAGSTSRKQVTAEELAAAQKGLSAAQKSLAEDEAYLKDLKHECQAKATEFEEEYKDRAAEVAVLSKAKGILTAKFAAASFIQLKSTMHVSSRSRAKYSLREDADSRKEKALKVLHSLGKSIHSTALISLSYRALADPFAKVKGMIEEMIEKLLQEAAEEAEGKAFCDKEMSETKASLTEKNEKLDTVSSRIEKATSAVERLSQEVSVLNGEIMENDKAMAAATKIRTDEKAAFTAAAKDYAESQEACAAAIEVLRSYYDSGAFFLQTKMKTQAKARMVQEDGVATGDSSAIIGLLEVAESDFSNLLAEAKAAEDAAIDEFNRMSTDAQVLKATKTAEVKGKKTEIASLKSTLMDYGNDKEGLNKELDAVLQYMDKLKPQCTVQVPSYEERKQRREKEIDGLKEALSVLEGGL